jgi:hypothetical protein
MAGNLFNNSSGANPSILHPCVRACIVVCMIFDSAAIQTRVPDFSLLTFDLQLRSWTVLENGALLALPHDLDNFRNPKPVLMGYITRCSTASSALMFSFAQTDVHLHPGCFLATPAPEQNTQTLNPEP